MVEVGAAAATGGADLALHLERADCGGRLVPEVPSGLRGRQVRGRGCRLVPALLVGRRPSLARPSGISVSRPAPWSMQAHRCLRKSDPRRKRSPTSTAGRNYMAMRRPRPVWMPAVGALRRCADDSLMSETSTPPAQTNDDDIRMGQSGRQSRRLLDEGDHIWRVIAFVLGQAPARKKPCGNLLLALAPKMIRRPIGGARGPVAHLRALGGTRRRRGHKERDDQARSRASAPRPARRTACVVPERNSISQRPTPSPGRWQDPRVAAR